jgi:ZIP family zinc transporter
MAIIFGLMAVVFTFLGGLFALRFQDKLHLILSYSAGAVIGVALFDLLPEAIELAGNVHAVSVVTSVMALGFVIFMILDRLIMLHPHQSLDYQHIHRGRLGAGSLSLHSFLDGVIIGLAFQVSSSIGLIVATAVLIHDFSDGINTVNLIIKNRGTTRQAFKWLVLDALAPVLGVISTWFFFLTQDILGLLLAVFCGFFLYIGASDLLPESYHRHPGPWTTLMTVLGIATLFVAVKLAG